MLKVILSYLRLLVNSRDELALSQAINIPYRGLAHKQFTVLRKVARDKNMPMFQVSTNLVCGRRGGLMVSVLDSGSSSLGLSQDKTLNSHSAYLHPRV